MSNYTYLYECKSEEGLVVVFEGNCHSASAGDLVESEDGELFTITASTYVCKDDGIYKVIDNVAGIMKASRILGCVWEREGA